MTTPQKKAFQIYKQLRYKTINLDDIVDILGKYGFEIIDYSRGKNEPSIDYIIEQLKVRSLIEKNEAFLCISGSVKMVFISEELSADEKTYALAHELGHIICDHCKIGIATECSFEEEYQANEFAHYLLNPGILISLKAKLVRNRKTVIVVGLLFILLSACLIGNAIYKSNLKYCDYYLTESGEKYHVKDCYYIRGKKTRRMTKEEYNSKEYEPCLVCIG